MSNDWYSLQYSQVVTSEDMYLGMSGKTPSQSHADNLVCTVNLPGAKLKDINLVVTKNRLEVMTQEFKLDVTLPRIVDSEDVKAQWISDLNVLKLVLKIVHELPI